MKAIVQHGYGSPGDLRFQEIDRPAITDDLVLIRVRAASVNALDWHMLNLPQPIRLIGSFRRSPTISIPGVDLAGEVEMVGKNVTRVRPGDEVFGCAKGTFAEYATAGVDGLAVGTFAVQIAKARAKVVINVV